MVNSVHVLRVVCRGVVQSLGTINATLRAHVSILIFAGRDFAPAGLQQRSFDSGKAADWRQGRRECQDCELSVKRVV